MIVRTSRKSIIRGLGAAAITMPFLRLLERPARAAPKKRLIIFMTPNGTVMNEFWPGEGCAFKPILEPLAPFKSKLVVMRGIDMKSAAKTPIPGDHLPDIPNALTGRQPDGAGFGNNKPTGISIDQVIADVIGKNTKLHSLHLGVQAIVSSFPLVARGPGQTVVPENSPKKAFDRLFSDLPAATGGMMMDTAPIDPKLQRLREDRLSVLSTVKDDLAAVRCQLGSAERYKFDAHVEAVAELERSLTFKPPAVVEGGMSAPSCKSAPAAPVEPGDTLQTKDYSKYPEIGKLQMDNVVAALACDLTRVIVLLWNKGTSQITHTWANAPGSHHGISHGSEGVTADTATREKWLVQIENWYAKQFAYLLGKLNSIPDENGTLLDNTATLWMHEQSNGYSHSRRDMPYVLAGSCAGYFRTGRCLNLGGTSHQNLLLSLSEAMGVPTKTIGYPEFCNGPLSELKAG